MARMVDVDTHNEAFFMVAFPGLIGRLKSRLHTARGERPVS